MYLETYDYRDLIIDRYNFNFSVLDEWYVAQNYNDFYITGVCYSYDNDVKHEQYNQMQFYSVRVRIIYEYEEVLECVRRIKENMYCFRYNLSVLEKKDKFGFVLEYSDCINCIKEQRSCIGCYREYGNGT